MRNCIFTAFDDPYVIYAKAWITSLRTNYPDHPPVIILYNGKDADVINSFASMPNVSLLDHQLDEAWLKSLNPGVIGSYMIYARLILWSDLFNSYDNVIYLDCDTLVLKPFNEIVDSEDFFCIADNSADGIFRKEFATDPTLKKYLAEDGMSFDLMNRLMINSGFFILPKKYRTKQHVDQLKAISARYDKYIMHSDQSVISIWVFLNQITISQKFQYNFQTHFIFKELIQTFDMQSISILHFSHWKPGKNFSELLIPSRHVINAYEQFEKYKTLSQ